MSAPGTFDAVVIEAVMVQQRAATAEMTQGTNSRGKLGWQDGHVRPVEKSVLQKVVAHTFLDRRKAAPMAMSVHQSGHQQLSAVTNDADIGIFLRDCGKRSRLPDGAVHDHNCAGRDHTKCSEARIGDCICAPHDDGLGHSLTSLQFGTPAVGSLDDFLRTVRSHARSASTGRCRCASPAAVISTVAGTFARSNNERNDPRVYREAERGSLEKRSTMISAGAARV